jgi:hypothetical protein
MVFFLFCSLASVVDIGFLLINFLKVILPPVSKLSLIEATKQYRYLLYLENKFFLTYFV